MPVIYIMPYVLEFIDWKSFLLGTESKAFLVETVVRTMIMFTVIVMSLRLLGKRGVKQLSVFELGVIVGLGSAAGDPMFYKDVGLLPGMVVFAVVLSLYRFITYLINHFDRVEKYLEGQPTCLVDKGIFLFRNFKKEPIARDEFFSQLRLHSVSHLGQLQQAILEPNGEVSVYYLDDEDVTYGLPVLPDLCDVTVQTIKEGGHYACAQCGHTEELAPATRLNCRVCDHPNWVKAINRKRVR